MSQTDTLLTIPPEHNPASHPAPQLRNITASSKHTLWLGRFKAMASDCEILMEGISQSLAEILLKEAVIETWRIEFKFSRYRNDNTMALINHSHGKDIEIDSETNALFDFADQCYQLSDGLFDISSGILRKIWHFDGSDKLPSKQEIKKILPLIGWKKINRSTKKSKHLINLPKGMELDLGGIGKEYAVDRSLFLLCQQAQKTLQSQTTPQTQTTPQRKTGSQLDQVKAPYSILVNYGGDLACSAPRLDGQPWHIAVESIKTHNHASADVRISRGAVATSGDANRFLLKDGIRYSHVLNPKTGCSITTAPHSVSVAGETCMQAGMLSTIASLYGQDAEAFLEAQEVEYWLQS